MNTYNTYQEAKIANPDCEIAVVSMVDAHTPRLGQFIAIVKSNHSRSGYSYANKERAGNPNITDGYYTICNPADYCMTVEKFLAGGHRFVEGDIYLDMFGYVRECGDDSSIAILNEKNNEDIARYILRASALEEKKPRTKVEYMKVVDSIFDLRPDFEAGELYISHCDGHYQQISNESSLHLACAQGLLYRRIETPMTWQDELYDYLDNSCEMNDDFDDKFTISIDDKPLDFNLNDEEFIDMCKFVASLNSVN